MSNLLQFTAIRYNSEIPENMRKAFNDHLEQKEVFGVYCYVWLNDDSKDPIYNLKDSDLKWKIYGWLDEEEKKKNVFHYFWS